MSKTGKMFRVSEHSKDKLIELSIAAQEASPSTF